MIENPQKGKRYRATHDSDEFFKDGEIVISLENDPTPFCIREKDYIDGKNDESDYDDTKTYALCDCELEEIEDKKCKFKVGDKIIGNDSNFYGITSKGTKCVVKSLLQDNSCVDDIEVEIIGDNRTFYVKSKYFDLLQESITPITIEQHGNKVIARQGKNVGVASCWNEDKFDMEVGTKIAIERLFHGKYADVSKLVKDGQVHAVKEVKRQAKTGEYVNIVKTINVPKINGEPAYKVGDIIKIIGCGYLSKFKNGHDVYGCDFVLNDSEYVVLENYVPNGSEIDFSKDEEIKVGDIVEVVEKNNFHAFDIGTKVLVTEIDENRYYCQGESCSERGTIIGQFLLIEDIRKVGK